MATGVTFPLSVQFLPTVSLTRQEIAEYRASASEIVLKTLEQEIEFRHQRQGQLDDSRWKFVKSKDRLKVFKRIPAAANTVSRGSHSPSGDSNITSNSSRNNNILSSHSDRSDSNAELPAAQNVVPMVVAIGKIEGGMEDALYGLHHKTTDEMRITTSFLNKHHLDSAVLHTIESGTDQDPFRYLGIKWRIAETPGGNLISNRDVCVLEFVGTAVDPMGSKYGFHVIKSIEAPWFPELLDPHVVRARMMLCCIYRQLDPTAVDCYMKGVFNLGGDLIDMIAYNTAADTLLGIAKSVDCAEAKKLTLRLIMEQKRRLKSFKRPGSARSFASGEYMTVDRNATSDTLDSDDDHDDDGDDEQEFGHDDICSVCHKKRSKLAKLASAWDRCRICHGTACSRCHVRKTIFARPKHMKVSCCKICIMAAKQLPVDPRDPYPVIGNMVST